MNAPVLAAAHRVLATIPADKRAQALRLLALPTDAQLCEITACDQMCDGPASDCDTDHPVTGILTADRLLDELVRGIASVEVTRDVLDYYDRGHRGPGTDPDQAFSRLREDRTGGTYTYPREDTTEGNLLTTEQVSSRRATLQVVR